MAVVDQCPGHKAPGRTVLQKLVYFCSVRLNLKVSYYAHYFGPYSEDVATAEQSLCALGFLSETRYRTDNGAWAYEYQPTNDGRVILKGLAKNADVEQVRSFISEITAIPGWDHSRTISCAAKVFFITRRMGTTMTESAISAQAKSFGWTLEPNTIDEVVSFLSRLGMVKTE